MKIVAVFLIFIFFGSVFAQSENDRSTTAKNFVDLLMKEKFAEAYQYFSESVKSQIPLDAMPQVRQQIVGAFGDFVKNSEAKNVSAEKLLLTCEFKKSIVIFDVSFDANGKITSFTVAEAKEKNAAKYETPSYAKPDLFEEREVTIGTGEWVLPATLTVPKGKTNLPAIVLVHGSGPNDRDETHVNSANKIFKDLAWGLASKGVAVLRYDKRTRVHGAKMGENFTVNEETVDDAVLAVNLLKKTPNINAKKIYVLGHSLGGMMIPRIGQRDKNIAGLVVFAGTARPLADVVVEQYYYLSSIDGTPSAATLTELEKIKNLGEKTKNLKASDVENIPTLLGVPVSYWVDLNGYNPTAVAKTLNIPMLILQGESDYQVTMKDFAEWKIALGTRKNVIFKSYPNLTHSFMDGLGGKPSPKDYDAVSHVKEIVITDIADWILNGAKK